MSTVPNLVRRRECHVRVVRVPFTPVDFIVKRTRSRVVFLPYDTHLPLGCDLVVSDGKDPQSKEETESFPNLI